MLSPTSQDAPLRAQVRHAAATPVPGSKDRCASRRGNLCAVRGHTSGIFVNRPSWAKVNPNWSLGHRLGVKARNCISNVCTSPSYTSTIKARNSKHKAGQAGLYTHRTELPPNRKSSLGSPEVYKLCVILSPFICLTIFIDGLLDQT